MIRAPALIDPCGRFLPALLLHDLHDRLQGRAGRANARWGKLDRPQASARLIWVVTGASRASVRLGVELARALQAARSDCTILLTYETEHPNLLAALHGLARITWGYGPADYIGAVQTVHKRLLPFGIVVAGVVPRPNLLALCEASRHALLVAAPQPASARFERIYPTHAAPCSGRSCALPADLRVLLDVASPDSAAADVLTSGGARRLWWWHGADAAAATRVFALFRGHLPHDLLVVSGTAAQALAVHAESVLRLSAWERTPAQPATLLLADEPRWLAALGGALSAIHFAEDDPDFLWLSLAAGAIASSERAASCASAGMAASLLRIDDDNTLIAKWQQLAEDEALRNRIGEEQRRAYAEEQRRAQAQAADLIERVCRWR